MYAFDVDGVLIDSKSLVARCYEQVGVTMPEGAWGKPWHEWLDDGRKHERKTNLYVEAIEDGEATWLDGRDIVAYYLRKGSPVCFVTGASLRAFSAIYRASGLRDVAVSFSNPPRWQVACTTQDKINTLIQWGANVYMDDIQDVGERIAAAVGCGFVHYAPDDFVGNIERLEAAWTPSS